MIYKINCQDYGKVYIGQTSRDLRSRTRENKRAIFKGVKNSLLVQHCIQNNHEFDLDDLKIIDLYIQWSKRLILEARHSICGPNAINEQICFPDSLQDLRQPQVTFSPGSFKALIYIRKPFMLKRVKVFLTETFTQKRF